MLHRTRDLATKSDKTVIVSTHILPDVQAVCDAVVIMVAGRVCMAEKLEVLRRPSAPAHHLAVHGPSDALLSRIQREGYRAERDATGRITAHGMDQAALDAVWRWAAEAGVGLRSLQAASNSLEDVFMNAIQEVGIAD